MGISFLGMTNILELVNPGFTDVVARVSLYQIDGTLAHTQSVRIFPQSQFDLILNEMPGFVGDSYGIVKIEFNDLLDGRMFYYRQLSAGADFEFAFGIPLSNPSFGKTSVGFNTYQPSLHADERANVVANWLTVVNLSTDTQQFTIRTHVNGGDIVRRELTLPPAGRADVDGGHGLAGSSAIGLHEIIPANARAPYIAQLIRYGGDAPGGTNCRIV